MFQVDVGKVAANAAGQAMIATTAETGRYAAERTGRHHDKVTSERIKEDFKDPKEAKQVEKMVKEANDISRKDRKVLQKSSRQREYAKKQFDKLSDEKMKLENTANTKAQAATDAKKDPNVPRRDIGPMYDEVNNLKSEINKIGKEIYEINKNMPEQKTLPKKNHFHFLMDDRKGQAAMDLENNNGARGERRILLEQDNNLSKKTHKTFTYSGKVEEHNYAEARGPRNLRPVYDPHEAARPETFNARRTEEDDQDPAGEW